MSSELPLRGIRVVDLGQAVAAPFAGMWLATMGAEVIHLESHRRLSNRLWPPFADDVHGLNRSGLYNLYNASKLSLTLDLRTDAGREIAHSLIAISDVVTENYSTGTMEKLGLGYQELTKIRPDVIMLSMSAVGRTGPMRHFVGYHSAVLMMSGLADITGYPQGHPRIMGTAFPDPVSGMYAVFAVLGALYRRSKKGMGQYIDVAMTEAMMSLMPEAIFDYTLNNRKPQRVGNEDPWKAPHGVYRCRGDDRWLAISVGSDEEWRALCEAADHKDWLKDPRFADGEARRRHRDELNAVVEAWTRELEPIEATRLLQDAGVPAGPSLTTEDLLNDPHLKERGFVVEVDHPEVGRRAMGSVPWKISEMDPPDHRPAPLIGQHNGYVLCEILGHSTEQMERWVEEGVVV